MSTDPLRLPAFLTPRVTSTFGLLALALWLFLAAPRAPGEAPPPPTPAWPAAADHCGTALHLLAALPAPNRGEPERLWLRNGEPTPLPLAGFTVQSGRRKVPLPDRIAAPGEVIELEPPRLRDRDGHVALVDPCGVRDELTWELPERGELVYPSHSNHPTHPAHSTDPASGPGWRPEPHPDTVSTAPRPTPSEARERPMSSSSAPTEAEADPHAQRYDELPYPNLVHGRSHPRTTGAIAALFSLDPPPVETARVLDLGCAAGMNILAMAADLPQATFVGVDISKNQVDLAREMASDLGLTNITFHCDTFQGESLARLPDKSFDYIICHGVYSWVAPPLRSAILEVYSRLLADDGIGYISYNTYPGWHFGNVVRELMLRDMDPGSPALARVLAARKALDRQLDASEDRSLSRALLTAERELLGDHSDSYLFHEYLTPEHHPLWFKDFAGSLAAFALPGLVLPSTQDGRIAHLMDALSPEDRADPIAQQQAIDDHLNNRFRRSIIARSHHRPALTLDPARLSRLHLRLPRDHLIVTDGAPSVRDRRGRLIPLQLASARLALEELRRVSPSSLPLTELVDLTPQPAHSEAAHAQRALLGTIVGLIFAEALEVTLSPVRCATSLPTHPVVPPLNRYQARRGDPIASRLFVSELVGELGLALVKRLDGHHGVDELVADTGATRDEVEQHLRLFVERGLIEPG
jgi:SAM-dependent methyltransferase